MPSSTRPRLLNSSAIVILAVSAAFLASCASSGPQERSMTRKTRSKEYFSEAQYGVKASPRVSNLRTRLPRGGGRDQLGRPYKVAGKWYYPKEDRRYRKVGARILVWRCLPWPADRQWRNLRHDASDGGAPDHAAAQLCARHQSQERQLGHRARQRPRSLCARPHHRPLQARRRNARLCAWRRRQGEGRICRPGAAGWT